MPLISKAFGDIITFTRASTATYFDSAGVLQSAAINAPRLDYNPSTLAAQGLLIEEQRVNSIRNNTMVGAVAGTPGTLPTNWFISLGGLTQEVVGIGSFGGVSYIDIRLSGTTTGTSAAINLETITGVPWTNGQVFTMSAWYQLVGGSTANINSSAFTINGYDASSVFISGAFISGTPSAALSTTWQRITRTFTGNNASLAYGRPTIPLTFSIGVAIDITLRIGLLQLELGAFATSVIPTTTAAVTRSADLASVNTLTPWFNATEGTLYAESFLTRQSATAGTNVFYIWNTSTSEIKLYYRGSGTTGATVVDATVNQADLTPTGVLTANTVAKLSLAYKANDFAASGNGGAAVTDATGTVPAGMSQVFLGGPNGILNGYIRRITYYPRRLSNAELQTITA